MAQKKGNDYFTMLVDNVKCSCEAAELLWENMNEYDYVNLPEKIQDIHEVEHRGDLGKHSLMEKLMKEFLPPIEREDIMALTNIIDDVTDVLDEVLTNLYMYNIRSLRPEVLEFAALIRKCCAAMKEMLEDFRNFRRSPTLKEKIITLNRLEEEGDQLYTRAVHRLYTEENDAVQILVWTTIYNCLEECCDCCEHVADSVEMAIMKNT